MAYGHTLRKVRIIVSQLRFGSTGTDDLGEQIIAHLRPNTLSAVLVTLAIFSRKWPGVSPLFRDLVSRHWKVWQDELAKMPWPDRLARTLDTLEALGGIPPEVEVALVKLRDKYLRELERRGVDVEALLVPIRVPEPEPLLLV
ncbi:hypothetical protein FJ938_22070 [Mesorhizobium sp. B2-4-14]|uniref:hypothetical protein n=1 Tax=Mesorhizobium sp. B2-4-14 TaxID=2589935 RepID=UPI001127CF35|nr:hypothetical protein [Mesorhizobium sp. B2-4-14]TPL00682.1 hypothetical protein FJ938_22070 [Mesorhizobium sp. B2-4-14]